MYISIHGLHGSCHLLFPSNHCFRGLSFKHQFGVICVILLFPALCNCKEYYTKSRASYYGTSDGYGNPRGACGFGNYGKTVNDGSVAAVSAKLWKNGGGCGACYQIFKTRDEVEEWARTVGRDIGVAVVIRRSEKAGKRGTRDKIELYCDRGRIFSNNDTVFKSKRIGCAFRLKSTKTIKNGGWGVKVQCGRHNHAFVERISNVGEDGNCGFRAIAVGLDWEESSWSLDRQDLIKETKDREELYTDIYGKEELLEIRNAFTPEGHGAQLPEKWLRMPEMGCFVATKYNVALVTLSLEVNTLYLPLRGSYC